MRRYFWQVADIDTAYIIHFSPLSNSSIYKQLSEVWLLWQITTLIAISSS